MQLAHFHARSKLLDFERKINDMTVNYERIIRNRPTGLYLGTSGAWTALREQARRFANISELLDSYFAQSEPSDIQLVMKPSLPHASEIVVDLF